MLSTLIALSSLTIFNATGGQGESIFPKSDPRNPSVLTDSAIFPYLDASSTTQLRWPASQEDWSGLKYVAPKANAAKLRILLLVFERDFTDPSFSNTLELNDKQRLIASMSRLRTYFSSVSAGDIDVEVVPRFITEPIFDASEAKAIEVKEYNQFKFEADDREERGPFAAILRVSGSGYDNSFVSLGGNEPGTALEQNFIRSVCNQLTGGLDRRFVMKAGDSSWIVNRPWPSFRTTLPVQLLDPGFRDDASIITKPIAGLAEEFRVQAPGEMVKGPISLTKESDALVFTENSIIRGGSVLLPVIPSAKAKDATSFTFEVRTKSLNPIAVGWTDVVGRKAPSSVSIGATGSVRIKTDGTWQSVTISRSNVDIQPFLTVPSANYGRTRNPHEVIRYEFRNFHLTNEPATAVVEDIAEDFGSFAGIETALQSGKPASQRTALQRILSNPSGYKTLQPKLLEMSTELEPGVAFAAVQAYGKIGIANDDLIGKAFMNRLVSTAPNEYAREAALLYFAEHPEQTSFEAIAPNIVRRSWRTRIATVKALAALDKTDQKAKPAARQLLLTACGQDMAIIRSVALSAMKPEVEAERKQLEYSLVNDPSEQVRLQCLNQLAAANMPKEILFGALADDSPYVREHVAEQLPLALKREALQRMVIDRDTYVRVAALQGFARLAEPTQPGEIQNTFTEEHPAVLLALVEGAGKGKWKLPAPVIETAKRSQSTLVKQAVQKLETK